MITAAIAVVVIAKTVVLLAVAVDVAAVVLIVW